MTESMLQLSRIAAVLTAVIALTFIIVGLIVQNTMIIAVFAVIGIAGLASYPAPATKRPPTPHP
ncbi:hypothetical protein ACEXQD_08875 [Herbiconiux sp. P15]|uniref:hypothetical protein n=1 Tax=Herbiconiux liukaitaii TaxID=3342799 RepID=UPI0035B96D1D